MKSPKYVPDEAYVYERAFTWASKRVLEVDVPGYLPLGRHEYEFAAEMAHLAARVIERYWPQLPGTVDPKMLRRNCEIVCKNEASYCEDGLVEYVEDLVPMAAELMFARDQYRE